jgi:hypothetical protein
MDNLKETAQRVIAWSRQHPYIAAAILAGIVLLAWLTIRNRKDDNGGGSAGNFSVGDEPGGGLGAAMPSAGSAGGGVGAGGVGGFEDLANLPVTESTTVNTVPASSGGGDIFTPGEIDLGGFTPAANYGFGEFAGGAAVASPVMDGLSQTQKSGLTGSGKSAGTTGARTPTTNAQPRRARADASPAYLAGKGQRFTGTHNGITYVNGYPLDTGLNLLGYNPETGGVAVGGQRDTGTRGSRRSG